MNREVREFIIENDLMSGDVIVAKKVGYRILDHFIVYVGQNYEGHLFMANSMKDGVRVYNEGEVFELVRSFHPVGIRRFQGTEYDREMAIERALSQEGEAYSLLAHNCEHFANYVQFGVKKSPQVVSAGIGLFVTVFLAGAFGLSKNK